MKGILFVAAVMFFGPATVVFLITFFGLGQAVLQALKWGSLAGFVVIFGAVALGAVLED